MKKLLSVLMALALALVPVLALAEAAEVLEAEYDTYTHTNEQYTFMYPIGWTMLNKENIQTIMESVDVGNDPELAQMLADYGPAIAQADMIMLVSENGQTNVSVAPKYVGMQANDEALLALAPQLVSQMSGAMENIEFVDEGSIIELNGINGLMLQYVCELAGMQVHGVQVYVSGAEYLYVLTYTCSNADELLATSEAFGIMLSSLQVK